MARTAVVSLAAMFMTSAMAGNPAVAEPTVDLSAYNPACGITVQHAGSDLCASRGPPNTGPAISSSTFGLASR